MNINPPPTTKELLDCQDALWVDAIYKEFPNFNVEDIDLTDEEYKTLTFQERWIRMVKKYIKE